VVTCEAVTCVQEGEGGRREGLEGKESSGRRAVCLSALVLEQRFCKCLFLHDLCISPAACWCCVVSATGLLLVCSLQKKHYC
jgi:hypothetical protein